MAGGWRYFKPRFNRKGALCCEMHALGCEDRLQMPPDFRLLRDAMHKTRRGMSELRQKSVKGREPAGQVNVLCFRSICHREEPGVDILQSGIFGGHGLYPRRSDRGCFIHDAHAVATLFVKLRQALYIAPGVFVKAPCVLP
jgi:hypothetical protein